MNDFYINLNNTEIGCDEMWCSDSKHDLFFFIFTDNKY